MFEIFDGEKLKAEAYEKAGADVGRDILELLKNGPAGKEDQEILDRTEVRDLPAVKAILYREAVGADIDAEIKKLNQKYHFGLDSRIVYEKSLERLLKQRAAGEIAADSYPDFSLVEDMYLNLFGEELMAEYRRTGQDFSDLLNEKATILREKNLVPGRKINDRIAAWYEKANAVEEAA